MSNVVTPAQVERRLYDLSKEIDVAHQDLSDCEMVFHTIKADFEIALAKSRIKNSHADLKMTAQMREDSALIENENLFRELAVAEATVKASRANANRLKTQVDIARSVSVSVRASMEI